MSDADKKSAGFQAVQPKIPGVAEGQSAKAKAANNTSERRPQKSETANNSKAPLAYLWAAGGGAIFVLVIALAWWAQGVSGPVHVSSMPTLVPGAQPSASQAGERLPVAPGAIATTSQMKEPWSTQKFLYHNADGDTVPALLVHLHGDNYWAISLREPFGTCELEFANVERLKDYYNFNSKYPMVGNPCSRTVYDLTQYGSGPNGLVRGEIVAGTGSRPPLAIEVQVEGQQIIASQSE